MGRPMVERIRSTSDSDADAVMVRMLRLEMTNLDLHNKLMQVAKQVRELADKHPDMAAEFSHLETILAGSTSADTSHPIGSPPYRKGD